MRKVYRFTDAGICLRPDMIFSQANAVATIKVMLAKVGESWISGYQISIYTMGPEAVSQLVYPSFKSVKFPTEEQAISFACLCIDRQLANSIEKDTCLMHMDVVKNYLKTFGKKI